MTERSAALSFFDEKVEHEPLYQDHSSIVKYSSLLDQEFSHRVGPQTKAMIRSGLKEMNYFQTRQPISRFQKIVQQHSVENPQDALQLLEFQATTNAPPRGPDAVQATSLSPPPLAARSQREITQWFQEEFEDEPQLGQVLVMLLSGVTHRDPTDLMESQLCQVKDPFPSSCDWILDEPLYHRFETDSANAALFIQGSEGSGKSVLAKFIVHRLRAMHPSAAVVSFFCQRSSHQASPAMILQHIILQINRYAPRLILRALMERPGTQYFTGKYDVDTLWAIFLSMINLIDRDVFIVIDGVSLVSTYNGNGR